MSNLVVTYLGPPGTFTEAAVLKFQQLGVLDQAATPQPVGSPAEALAAVRSGVSQWAVVAIESSVDGPVAHTLDALAAGEQARIVAEVDIPIEFSILVRPGTTLEQVRTISCHPVARPQVAQWLAANLPDAEFIPASSNGAAAQAVSEGRICAAAAPARAGEVYGLEPLAAGVADVADARTRFILISKHVAVPERTGNDRTGVVFTLPNEPGSLVGALTEFASRGVDLSRIESRPTRTGMGTYRFHIDLRGHISDPPVAEALRALYRRSEDMQFIGSWPAVDSGPAGWPEMLQRWDDADAWLREIQQ